MEIAQLEQVDHKGFVKSEFTALGDESTLILNRNTADSILNQYALSNGLDHPEFRREENELGIHAYLRAYKTLKDEKLNERHMMMEAHFYCKGNNILALYVMSEAKDYPTPEIIRFLNSIKLK